MEIPWPDSDDDLEETDLYEASLQPLDQAELLEVTTAEKCLQNGDSCNAQQFYQRAIDWYTKGISISPTLSALFRGRAMALTRLGRQGRWRKKDEPEHFAKHVKMIRQALVDARQCSTLAPNEPDGILLEAQAWACLGEYPTACDVAARVPQPSSPFVEPDFVHKIAFFRSQPALRCTAKMSVEKVAALAAGNDRSDLSVQHLKHIYHLLRKCQLTYGTIQSPAALKVLGYGDTGSLEVALRELAHSVNVFWLAACEKMPEFLMTCPLVGEHVTDYLVHTLPAPHNLSELVRQGLSGCEDDDAMFALRQERPSDWSDMDHAAYHFSFFVCNALMRAIDMPTLRQAATARLVQMDKDAAVRHSVGTGLCLAVMGVSGHCAPKSANQRKLFLDAGGLLGLSYEIVVESIGLRTMLDLLRSVTVEELKQQPEDVRRALAVRCLLVLDDDCDVDGFKYEDAAEILLRVVDSSPVEQQKKWGFQPRIAPGHIRWLPNFIVYAMRALSSEASYTRAAWEVALGRYLLMDHKTRPAFKNRTEPPFPVGGVPPAGSIFKGTKLSKFLLKQCNLCGQSASEGQLKLCARCKAVRYCSVECQKSDWKTHKAACMPNPEKP